MKTNIYTCSAVIRDMLCTDNVQAVSEKQAWYLFSKKNGFKQRDFKIIGVKESAVVIPEQNTQLTFNI